MYMFSSEELKAKAPLGEPYILGDVIFLACKTGRLKTWT